MQSTPYGHRTLDWTVTFRSPLPLRGLRTAIRSTCTLAHLSTAAIRPGRHRCDSEGLRLYGLRAGAPRLLHLDVGLGQPVRADAAGRTDSSASRQCPGGPNRQWRTFHVGRWHRRPLVIMRTAYRKLVRFPGSVRVWHAVSRNVGQWVVGQCCLNPSPTWHQLECQGIGRFRSNKPERKKAANSIGVRCPSELDAEDADHDILAAGVSNCRASFHRAANTGVLTRIFRYTAVERCLR